MIQTPYTVLLQPRIHRGQSLCQHVSVGRHRRVTVSIGLISRLRVNHDVRIRHPWKEEKRHYIVVRSHMSIYKRAQVHARSQKLPSVYTRWDSPIAARAREDFFERARSLSDMSARDPFT